MQQVIVSDFIKTSLKKVQQNQDSPNFEATALNDGLNELNGIIDSWNTDGKMIYSMQYQTFPLVPGQQTYSIGPSNTANFNTGTSPRPSFLEFASFQQTTSNPVADIPMKIVDADEWASIVTKNISSAIGFYIYLDGQWPLGNISVWPIPAVSANLVLTSWSFLNSQLSLTSNISMPPGYYRGLSLDLSISLAPYYGKSSSAAVQLMSSQLAAIKRNIGWVNLRGGRMQYSNDAQSSSGSGGAYDAVSDQVL